MLFSDIVTAEVTCADIPRMLREWEKMGIVVYNVKITDDLSAVFSVHRRDYPLVQRRIGNQGGHVKIISRAGILSAMIGMCKRPVLLLGIAVIITLSVFLPSRVLFVEVEGNQTIPSRLILQKAEECGIHLGASRRQVRSEQVKNMLLSAIPDLQWAGVNTSGCVATITVEEKSVVDAHEKQSGQVGSIIAAQDGIITECTVRRGNQLCAVGQAVKAGQTLVSGYLDCGLTVQATRAEAEVMAETLRDLEVISPATYTIRGGESGCKTKFSLQIGKKLINFYKDSGISDVTCVKMYSKKYLTLPGGRVLPIALVTERWYTYGDYAVQMETNNTERLLETAAQTYLTGQMVSGEILSADTDCRLFGDVYMLTGRYACHEMIGQIRIEESLYTNGENDRANR